MLRKALEGLMGVPNTFDAANREQPLRLATPMPALGDECVFGDTDNAVYVGLLALAETRDGRLGRAPVYTLDEFTNLIEDAFQRDGDGEARKRQAPAEHTQRRKDANSRFNDLRKKLRSHGLDADAYLSNYCLTDAVSVDLLVATQTLRALEQQFDSARVLTRDGLEDLLRRIAPPLHVIEQAFVGDSRFPNARRWLQHVSDALFRSYADALRLKLECHDRLQAEAAHRQAIWDLSDTFHAMELQNDALEAELRAVARERELETVVTSVNTRVKKLLDEGGEDNIKAAKRLMHRVRAAQSRLRVRYDGSVLEGASTRWVGREGLLTDLENFWRAGNGGIFALIGLGGCGKTALIRRVLERNSWLEPPYPPDAPDGIFVWTFGADHAVDLFTVLERASAFFAGLLSARTLERLGSAKGVDQLVAILRHASRDHRLLIVLDGLETQQFQERTRLGTDELSLQESSAIAARGEFKDLEMTTLLRDIARTTNVSVFVTSRVSLASLASDSYEQRDPTRMDAASAAELFAFHGVGDTDAVRTELARRLDYHVLSLSIVAPLLARHHRGEPNALGLLPELPKNRGESDLQYAIRRLDSVLAQVDEYLEPLELILLGIIGSLAIPISRDLLDDILLSFADATAREEPPMEDVEAALKVLEQRGLMFTVPTADGTRSVSSHVLVRHYYGRVLPPSDGVGIRQAAEAILATAADELPRDSALRQQLLIERLRQLAKLSRFEEAIDVYREQLGGYRGFGWQRGDHATGMELMNMLIEAAGDKAPFRLHMDRALYIKNLALLEESAHALRRLSRKAPSAKRADVFQNLAGIYLLRGRLEEAWTAAHRAVKASTEDDDGAARREAYTRLADVAARVGQVDVALEAHAVVSEMFVVGESFVQVPGHPVGWLYLMQGRAKNASQALGLAQEALDGVEDREGAYGMIRARQEALRSRLALLQDDIDAARRSSELLNQWVRGDNQDHEMVAAAALTEGLVAEGGLDDAAAEAAFRRARDAAAERGLGLYWVDAVLRLASIAERRSDPDAALALADLALGGQSPPVGYALAGAAAEGHGYVWGVLEARRIRARILASEAEREAEIGMVVELTESLGVLERPER